MPCYVKYQDGTQRAFVRYKQGEPYNLRPFGPKTSDHSTVGMACPACGDPFRVGEFTTLIPLGPGKNEEARERYRDGRYCLAAAIEVHFACVTGVETMPAEVSRS